MRMIRNLQFYLSAVLFMVVANGVHAQSPTVGLRHYDPATTDGYILFTPETNTSAFLIDRCGQKINEWTFSETPALTVYLLENGSILRAGIDSLEIRDWNNNLVWSYAMTANGFRQHHDIEPLPNGNILCICSDIITGQDAINAGRDPNLVFNNTLRSERIVELEPVGTNQVNVVWEWKAIDHVIQDYDALMSNYGTVEDHPELIDLNYVTNSSPDWLHYNGIDYNENLDQIIMSSRHMSEIYIVDHSTTTAEAASHSGGNSGKGGDYLWRWGNPEVYRQGTAADRRLYRQHDAKWVEQGALDEGKISVFNNEGDGSVTFSEVGLIEPQIIGGQYQLNNNAFLPTDYDWTWNGSVLGNVVLETKKSGAQVLANGNFLVTETSKGQVSEFTKSGTHLWTYTNPTGYNIYNQYDPVQNEDNKFFRGEFYAPDYAGLVGQDLTPQGIVENLNPISDTCSLQAGLNEVANVQYNLFPNPTFGTFTISSDQVETISIMTLDGRPVETWKKTSQVLSVDLSSQPAGVYLVYLSNSSGNQAIERIVLKR